MSLFAVARLPKDGAIRLDRESLSWGDVFHRGNTLPVRCPDFDTLNEAKAQLGNDPELFVMEFGRDKTCEMLWFTKAQQDAGLPKRLDTWKGCYGRYPISTMREA